MPRICIGPIALVNRRLVFSAQQTVDPFAEQVSLLLHFNPPPIGSTATPTPTLAAATATPTPTLAATSTPTPTLAATSTPTPTPTVPPTEIVSGASTALQVWYDAADTTTFVPAATDEQTITQWSDKSNFAQNANPVGGASARPNYENSTLQNGNGYLEFGADNVLSVNPFSTLVSAQRFVAFVVAKSLDLTTSNCLITTNQGDIRLVIGNTSIAVGMSGTNNFGTTTVTDDNVGSNVGNWHQYTIIYDGTQTGNANRLKLRRNKIDLSFTFTGTIPATFSGSNNSLLIGQRADGTGQFFGYIGEIILFNKALTQAEYQDVENYLSSKWGL